MNKDTSRLQPYLVFFKPRTFLDEKPDHSGHPRVDRPRNNTNPSGKCKSLIESRKVGVVHGTSVQGLCQRSLQNTELDSLEKRRRLVKTFAGTVKR